MLRTIKIRVWDTEDLAWRELPDLYGSYQTNAYRTFGEPFCITNFWNTEDQTKFKEGKLIIEQWTGRHDENYKEIYDGDIVEYGFFGKNPQTFQEKIGWECGGWRMIAFDDSSSNELYSQIKVIGNIHENPELMKEYE